MSRSVRLTLLAGCGLLVLLEGRRAGDSLGVALAGPYSAEPRSAAVLAGASAPGPVQLQLPVFLMLQQGALPIAGRSAVGGR